MSWSGRKGRGVRAEHLGAVPGGPPQGAGAEAWSGAGERPPPLSPLPVCFSSFCSLLWRCHSCVWADQKARVGDLEGRCDEKSLVDLVDEYFVVVSDKKEN